MIYVTGHKRIVGTLVGIEGEELLLRQVFSFKFCKRGNCSYQLDESDLDVFLEAECPSGGGYSYGIPDGMYSVSSRVIVQADIEGEYALSYGILYLHHFSDPLHGGLADFSKPWAKLVTTPTSMLLLPPDATKHAWQTYYPLGIINDLLR